MNKIAFWFVDTYVCVCVYLYFSVGLAYSDLILLKVMIFHRYVEFRHENSVFIKIVTFRCKKRCYNDFRFEVSRNTSNYVKFGHEILIRIEIVNFVTKNNIMENWKSKMNQKTLSNTKPSYNKLWKEKLISVTQLLNKKIEILAYFTLI